MAANPTGVEIRNGKICIWFVYRGKRCREVLQGWANTPGNIKKAGNLRAMIVSEINLGEFKYRSRFPDSAKARKLDTTVSKALSFDELSELWLESHKIELAASTLRNVKSQVVNLVRIVGPYTQVSSIKHSDVLAYRNELLTGLTFFKEGTRANKAGRAVRTVDMYISLLSRILRFAFNSNYITDEPYKNIKKLHKGRLKPDPLLKKEFSQLLMAVQGQARNLWQLAVYSGMRHGELCALAWSDIDLVKGTLKVTRNLTKSGIFTPPKTKASVRTISLLAPAIKALEAQKELTGKRPSTEIIFNYREYGKTETQHLNFVFQPRMTMNIQKPHYSHSSIMSKWNIAIKHSGVRRRSPYHTRHTFACWLLSAGANPSFIAHQMGHSNAQMVFEVYGSWMEDMNDEQIKLLDEKLAL